MSVHRARMTRSGFRYFLLAACTLMALALARPASAVPDGFRDELVTGGLRLPTAMAMAPDGRVFIAEQAGALRVVKGGALRPTPFVSLRVNSVGERGLLGVALHPNFATNGYVYLYHTVPGSPAHNRVTRFTAAGDVARAGSAVTILRLDDLRDATNHNGGAIHFGKDGKLYVAVGENAQPANAQSLATRLGKILRINADGSIPARQPDALSRHRRHAHGRQPRHLGRGPAQPVHLRLQPPQRVDADQRGGRPDLRGDQPRSARAPTMAGPRPRARPATPASPARSTPTGRPAARPRAARSPAAPSTIRGR